MPSTRIQVVQNNFPALRARLALEIPLRLDAAAKDLRDNLANALESGVLPIQSDTSALATGLSVQTRDGDDSAVRLAEALTAYLAGGKWTEPVRQHVTREAYTAEHFAERVGTVEPLPTGGYAAAVLCLLGWGFWWEFGHSNVFTGQYEHRPWMLPATMLWAQSQLKAHFAGLIQ